jgi:hypothetical protein
MWSDARRMLLYIPYTGGLQPQLPTLGRLEDIRRISLEGEVSYLPCACCRRVAGGLQYVPRPSITMLTYVCV